MDVPGADDTAGRLHGSGGGGPTGRLRIGPTPGLREGQAVLIAETSNSRVILSLTRTPPVSSEAFHVMP